MDVSIDGPTNAEIKRQEKKGNRTDVIYLPMSPGEYNVNVKVKGKHIHGSPFSAKISGRWVALLFRERGSNGNFVTKGGGISLT